jgi:hypothetical protein
MVVHAVRLEPRQRLGHFRKQTPPIHLPSGEFIPKETKTLEYWTKYALVASQAL